MRAGGGAREPEGGRWRRLTTRVAIGAVVVLVAVAVLGDLGLYYYTYSSHYAYQVELSGNGTISNVQLFLPVPTEDGTSVTGAAVAGGDAIYPIGRPGQPHDWDYALVETDAGPRLRITADEVSFEPRYYRWVVGEDGRHHQEPIPAEAYDASDLDHGVERSFVVHVFLRSGHRIDTRTPVGDEPLLAPGAERTPAPCPTGESGAECFAYGTAVEARYDAAPDADVSIRVELVASNAWMAFLVAEYRNAYVDQVGVDLSGGQAGPVPATGSLVTGEGDYPWPVERQWWPH